MSKTVTVNLRDLKALVKLLFACSVESSAQRMIRKKQPKDREAVVKQYLEALVEMMPAAREKQRTYFHELLSSLRSGSDVPLALANFVAREAKSSAGTRTKVRRSQ
jgi:hypothetical protein